jgi:hypothetical protein
LFSFALKKKKIKRRKNFVLYHIISIENNSHLLKWKYLTFVYETSYYVSLVNDYNANMFNRLCWCWHLLLFFLSSSSPPSSKRRERESVRTKLPKKKNEQHNNNKRLYRSYTLDQRRKEWWTTSVLTFRTYIYSTCRRVFSFNRTDHNWEMKVKQKRLIKCSLRVILAYNIYIYMCLHVVLKKNEDWKRKNASDRHRLTKEKRERK